MKKPIDLSKRLDPPTRTEWEYQQLRKQTLNLLGFIIARHLGGRVTIDPVELYEFIRSKYTVSVSEGVDKAEIVIKVA